MRRLLLLLTIAITLAGCGNSDKARQELAQLNLEYSESTFIESARDGNADAVKLFLEGGMDPDVKTREGQTPLMVAALEITSK